MKSFKKILASIGMLGVAVPTALSVVACGEVEASFDINPTAKTAIETALNKWKDSIIDVKGLTYKEFFNIKEDAPAPEADKYDFLQEVIYDVVHKALVDYKGEDGTTYDKDAIDAQMKEVKNWAKSAISLVYADLEVYENPEKSNQVIMETIADGGNKTLNDLFVDAVKKHYGVAEDDALDAKFWTDHSKATLAVKVNGNIGGVNLDAHKTLLTFTFAQ